MYGDQVGLAVGGQRSGLTPTFLLPILYPMILSSASNTVTVHPAMGRRALRNRCNVTPRYTGFGGGATHAAAPSGCACGAACGAAALASDAARLGSLERSRGLPICRSGIPQVGIAFIGCAPMVARRALARRPQHLGQ